MFKIGINVTLESLLDLFEPGSIDYSWGKRNIDYNRLGKKNREISIGNTLACFNDEICLFRLSIEVHGQDIMENIKYSALVYYLRGLNNILFDLLYASKGRLCAETVLYAGYAISLSVLSVEIDNDKIIFRKTDDFKDVIEKPIDIALVYEEAIAKINDFKDKLFEVAKRLKVEDPLNFMHSIFLREERYTDALHKNPDYDWLNYYYGLVDAQNRFIHYARSSETLNLLNRRYDEFPRQGDYTRHAAHGDFYNWLPLETAWNEYKKKHL